MSFTPTHYILVWFVVRRRTKVVNRVRVSPEDLQGLQATPTLTRCLAVPCRVCTRRRCLYWKGPILLEWQCSGSLTRTPSPPSSRWKMSGTIKPGWPQSQCFLSVPRFRRFSNLSQRLPPILEYSVDCHFSSGGGSGAPFTVGGMPHVVFCSALQKPVI